LAKKGTPWREPGEKPSNWDVHAQLRNIGVTFDGETIVVDPGAGTF
jgi:hypothetical protein